MATKKTTQKRSTVKRSKKMAPSPSVEFGVYLLTFLAAVFLMIAVAQYY